MSADFDPRPDGTIQGLVLLPLHPKGISVSGLQIHFVSVEGSGAPNHQPLPIHTDQVTGMQSVSFRSQELLLGERLCSWGMYLGGVSLFR